MPAEPKADASQARLTRTKNGTIRARGGLVHGTGRVRANGTIKRSPKEAQTPVRKASAPTPSNATTPTGPVRHRTVIDQTPVPLYCSDECRLADLQSSSGLDINFNPEQHISPPLSAVPTGSRADISPNEESDSSVGSSLGSDSSSVPSAMSHNGPSSPAASSSSLTESQQPSYPIPKAYAALASIYPDLPACPPPPPLLRTDTSSSSESDRWDTNYESGIIMAARRINEALATKPETKKRPSWSTPSAMLSTAYALKATAGRETIPGWTDGSDKWRASVYSFASPSNSSGEDKNEEERLMRAYTYKGYVSTPLRSSGVYSTMGEQSTPCASAPAYHHNNNASSSHHNAGPQMARARSEAEELYNKFDLSFTRRSESRTSLAHHQLSTSPTGSTRSLPATSSSYTQRRKEVPILKKGAEGKLLVPDVKMRRVDSVGAGAGGSGSVGSWSSSCAGSVYGGVPSSGRRVQSPLSRQGSEASVVDRSDEGEHKGVFPFLHLRV